MGLANGDVIQVTYNGNYQGSQIRTILHFQCATTGSGDSVETDLDRVAAVLYNPLTYPYFNKLQARTVEEFQWTGIVAKRVSPVQTIRVQRQQIVNGLNPDIGLPSNSGITVTKQTLTPGRRGIGSTHFAGVGRADATGAQVDANALVAWNAIALDMVSGVNIPAANNLLIVPGLYHGTTFQFPFSRLWDTVVQDSMRVMYRRTLRVGI